MTLLIDRAGFAAQMHKILMTHAALGNEEIDGMRLLQLLAGVTVETLLLFDDPDEGLMATFRHLEEHLGCAPCPGRLGAEALPPAYVTDRETEQGRMLARKLFEEWLDCAYNFQEMIVFFAHNVIVRLEEAGQPRAETFRLYMECAARCMAYEIAAQELCDIVIDMKVGGEGWSLGESVSGLSAVAGRCLALSSETRLLQERERERPGNPHGRLDQVAYVMTQEAVRLGIPAGTDWRFGLAANDCPASAPFDLIFSLWPCCREFFEVINLSDPVDQAVACAKAAGRMLAVAAGGEMPELEPVIAKPLAMAAMTETYRVICRQEAAVSQI